MFEIIIITRFHEIFILQTTSINAIFFIYIKYCHKYVSNAWQKLDQGHTSNLESIIIKKFDSIISLFCEFVHLTRK